MAHRPIWEHKRDIQLAGVHFLAILQSSGPIYAREQAISSFSDSQAIKEACTKGFLGSRLADVAFSVGAAGMAWAASLSSQTYTSHS